jgi:hypothetical protein
MGRLITQDLISGVDWLISCPPSWKDKAYTDLKNKLGRVKTGFAPAAKKGVDFENFLNQAINNKLYEKKDLKCSEEFKILMLDLKDFQQQKKTKSFIKIEDTEYCLYGKIDYYRKDLIVDLKTTDCYKGEDKYLSSYQHKIYCYNERINSFVYKIVEFENETTKIKDIYSVYFDVIVGIEELKLDIIEKIISVIEFLKTDKELFALYNNKYCMF